jgi:hypothetical protein
MLLGAGSLASLSNSTVKGELLLWFQCRTYLQQLHAAIATSIHLLDKLARELLDLVSQVQNMVKESGAVPKQTILLMFYRIGQHFEVQVWFFCALVICCCSFTLACLSKREATEQEQELKTTNRTHPSRADAVCRQPLMSRGRLWSTR